MYGYYYRAGKSWEDVRLWEATKDNPQQDVKVEDLLGGSNCWNICTFKDLALEMKCVLNADYSYPIIVDEDGNIIDGAHRVVHAYIDGKEHIKAVVIGNDQWPEPDYDEARAVEKRAECEDKPSNNGPEDEKMTDYIDKNMLLREINKILEETNHGLFNETDMDAAWDGGKTNALFRLIDFIETMKIVRIRR